MTGTSRGLVGELAATLGRRITTGLVVPGTIVDPEALAVEFGTSRTVVREALKVVAAQGPHRVPTTRRHHRAASPRLATHRP